MKNLDFLLELLQSLRRICFFGKISCGCIRMTPHKQRSVQLRRGRQWPLLTLWAPGINRYIQADNIIMNIKTVNKSFYEKCEKLSLFKNLMAHRLDVFHHIDYSVIRTDLYQRSNCGIDIHHKLLNTQDDWVVRP